MMGSKVMDGFAVEVKYLDQRMREKVRYATGQSAGIDLHACSFDGFMMEDRSGVTVAPGETITIGTGIALHIGSLLTDPETQNDPMVLAGFVFPRSGLGAKFRIRLANTIGVIDADYQGEIKLVVENGGKELFRIDALDRLAQLVIMPVVRPGFFEVQEFSVPTERGEGGFGSTGK